MNPARKTLPSASVFVFIIAILPFSVASIATVRMLIQPHEPSLHNITVHEAAYVPTPSGKLTFATDIKPIIGAHCASCHHTGEVAPFALLSYSDVKKRAHQIVDITSQKAMPPWKADSHGEFLDENRLTTQELGVLKQWYDEGAIEGEATAPIAVTLTSSEWRLGKPDLVLTPTKPFTLQAEGRDDFHTYLLPTGLKDDVYLSAVEVKPGNRKVCHHTVLYVDTDGRARNRAEAAGADNYASTNGAGVPPTVIDIWTPGKLARHLPDGVGIALRKGADLALEVHYHRSGKQEIDQTKVGLYFTRKPVKRTLRVFGLAARRLFIPPGEKAYHTDAAFQVPDKVTLYSIFPHMHLLGKRMTVELTEADGSKKTLVDVPDWDFNWQNTYLYKSPVPLTPGQSLHMSAVYDNSTSNPRNPTNPPKFVTWGEQTTDEMSLVFFGYTVDREDLTAGIKIPEARSIINH